jgi:hypothetical protein
MRIRNRHTVLPTGIRPGNPSRRRTGGSRSAAQSAIAAKRARPGQHRAYRHRQQAGQPVTHPAPATRIGHRGQRMQQIGLAVIIQGGGKVNIGGYVGTDSVDQRR